MGKDMRELTNEQRRQQIDAGQVFAAFRQTRHELLELSGNYRWRTISGREYLIKRSPGHEASLGPRSPHTEALLTSTLEARATARKRRDSLGRRLATMRPVNRAMGLGRLPDIAARIIDALDRVGLLDGRVRIAGTNALFAYEAASGVHLDSGLVATGDLDVLLDARTALQIAAADGIDLGRILRQTDRSFRVDYGEFAVNAAGYEVDILRPSDDNATLLAGQPFEAFALSERGNPVFMSAPQPKAMAKHKRWLSTLASRNASKRPRDEAQAKAIEHLVHKYRLPATGWRR